MKEKVVLAFSGGLDTSFCAIYLSVEKGMEVHTAIANTGGFSKEELISLVTIFAVTIGLMLFNYDIALRKSRDSQRKQDIRALVD